MNLNPFLDLIINILDLYKLALTIWILLSWFISFNIINRHQPLVAKITETLDKIIEPVLQKIRNHIPNMGGVDLSAIILFLLIGFLKSFLRAYLYR